MNVYRAFDASLCCIPIPTLAKLITFSIYWEHKKNYGEYFNILAYIPKKSSTSSGSYSKFYN